MWRFDGHAVLSDMEGCWKFWAELMFCFMINRMAQAAVWTLDHGRTEVGAKKRLWGQQTAQWGDLAVWVPGQVLRGYIEVLTFSDYFVSHEISLIA